MLPLLPGMAIVALLFGGPILLVAGGVTRGFESHSAVLWRSVWTSAIATAVVFPIAKRSARVLVMHPSRYAGLIVDIPLACPPIVVGLALLAVSRGPLQGLDNWLEVTASPFAVVVAQMVFVLPFATRLFVSLYERQDRRSEAVLLTFGCPRETAWAQAIESPSRRSQRRLGIAVWAQAFAVFGPVLIFAGATQGRTEIASTAIYLTVSEGRLADAGILSLMMLLLATAISILADRPPGSGTAEATGDRSAIG